MMTKTNVLLIGSPKFINFYFVLNTSMGFPGGSEVKDLPANAGDLDLIPGSGRRKRQPTPVFLPGKSQGQRNLAGYLGSQKSQTSLRTK